MPRTKKPLWRHLAEWLIAFALVGGGYYFIFHFIGEPFKVKASGSFEGFNEGDIYWISKSSCGPRMPRWPVSIPLTDIYWKGIERPYERMDSLRLARHQLICHNDLKPDSIPPFLRPVAMGRVIGMPGDTLRIYRGKIYINGLLPELNGYESYHFEAVFEDSISKEYLLEKYDLVDIISLHILQEITTVQFEARRDEALKLAGDTVISSFSRRLEYSNNPLVYNTGLEDQNKDNYGPVYLPRKGDRLDSTYYQLSLYSQYELSDTTARMDNTMPVFKNDYYFMLNDRRIQTNDSRFFGALPEYLIIGEPSFLIWEECQ